MTHIPRIFKIGTTRIVEDASTSDLSAEVVRERLKVNSPVPNWSRKVVSTY